MDVPAPPTRESVATILLLAWLGGAGALFLGHLVLLCLGWE